LRYGLDVWKETMRLAREIYGVSAAFPDAERFGLTSQIRRCAVSVPSNITAGAGRGNGKGCAHCQRVVRGSLMELDSQRWIARDLDFVGGTTELHASIQRIEVMPGAPITSKA
jgi:four helix bundle protein